MGGLSTHGTGRYERAIRASQEAIAADPDLALAYGNLATSYFLTGRFPEAEGVIQRAAERKLEIPLLVPIRYYRAALKGNHEEMERVIADTKGKRRVEQWISHLRALALARSGHLHEAQQASDQAVDLAMREDERESAASYRGAQSVWEALYGNSAEARRKALAAMELSKHLNLPYREGFIKNRYIGRTFIMPGQSVRRKSVRQKLNAIDMEIGRAHV